MAGGTRRARKEARSRLGRLRDLTIATKTRIRYEKAVQALFRWCDLVGIEQFESNARATGAVEEFIEMCWEEGEPRSMACDALSGLQFFVPEMKGKLVGAWRLCKAWQRQELPARATPLSRDMVLAMAMRRIKRNQWRTAAAYLIGFDVFLRTGEILAVRKQDVVLDSTSGNTAVVHLGYTKSGKRRGEPESVVLRNAQSVLTLAHALEDLLPGENLVGMTPGAFRAGFAADIRALGLRDTEYKPYSLRRGGATHRFKAGDAMAAVAEAGRWAHLSTCRIYVNDAVAELTQITLPKAISRRIDALAGELRALLAA